MASSYRDPPMSPSGDAFAAGCPGHGDAADRGERSASANAELIHGPGPAGLHIEELAVGRRGGIDGPRIGCVLAFERELAAEAGLVGADRAAAIVGGEERVAAGVSDDEVARLDVGDREWDRARLRVHHWAH